MGKYNLPEEQIPTRVLLVDQDAQILALFVTLLEHYGHEVKTAASWKEALTVIGEFCPQVIFTDIMLLASSGFELVKELRKRSDCADTFIVALTGYGALMDSSSWTAAGFNRILPKPANIDDIIAVLGDVAAGGKWNAQIYR